jgi:glutathione S-transferase
MSGFHLILGNKNYSSWSLRPWILMRHLGVQFDETIVPLDTPQFKDEIAHYGPTGRVPVLQHGAVTVWDSLAICEYIAEVTGRGWPTSAAARAMARSVSAEMHSGFGELRSQWPMIATARRPATSRTPGLDADIARIEALWGDCRARFGGTGGPWLFGDYSVADAMYAPVVLRFNTYGTPRSQVAREYVATTLEDASLQSWLQAAKDEPWKLAKYEGVSAN